MDLNQILLYTQKDINNDLNNIINTIHEYGTNFRNKYINNDKDEIGKNIIDFSFIIRNGYLSIQNMQIDLNLFNNDMDIDTFYEKLLYIENPNESIKKNMYKDISDLIKYINDVRNIIKPSCDEYKKKRNELKY